MLSRQDFSMQLAEAKSFQKLAQPHSAVLLKLSHGDKPCGDLVKMQILNW